MAEGGKMIGKELKTKVIEIWKYFNVQRCFIMLMSVFFGWFVMFIVWVTHGEPVWIESLGDIVGYFIGILLLITVFKFAVLMWNQDV